MRYELFYLVGVSRELDLEKIKGEVDEIVQNYGGIFEEKMTQEKRKMAYKIKRDTHGIYVAKRFNIEELSNVPKIINKLNLNSGVLRFILSDTQELPELKTKEERIEQEEKRNAAELLQKEQQASLDKEKALKKEKVLSSFDTKNSTNKNIEVAAKKTEPIRETTEDLDKKLEEILNI